MFYFIRKKYIFQVDTKFWGRYNSVMKKIIICAIVLLLGIFLVFKRIVTFVWVNPYTYTGGYSQIAETVRGIDEGLKFAKSFSAKDGLKFSYIFENLYGSGFLNNNSIPNDLDFSVGLDLGEYEYDGINSEEIAQSVVEKMNSFQYLFNYYINSSEDNRFYIDKSQMEILSNNIRSRKKNIRAISDNLANAIRGKEYISRTFKRLGNGSEMELPYVMRANEILIENYDPIMLYSDVVSYNSEMPRYVRSISIIPEFFITVKSKDASQVIEIVPESFMGERMQLTRRFFASSTFVGGASRNYLKNTYLLNDDEKYLHYRMTSFKRHLQEISNIEVLKDRPVKMLKRVMQTADIISPLLDESTMDEISKTVQKNMQNRDIQLLNEYSNICNNLLLIQEHPNLYMRLLKDGKIKIMYDVLLLTVNEMEERKNIQKVGELRDFAEKTLSKILTIEDAQGVVAFKTNVFEQKYKPVNDIVNSAVYSLLADKDKLDKYTVMFNKIYTDAGYHKVSLYWLDSNTIGVLKDDFTKNIKDLKSFAKENKLVGVNYKFVTASQAPKLAVKYAVWARFNPSKLEQENFEKMNRILLEDKKNFNVKLKFAF